MKGMIVNMMDILGYIMFGFFLFLILIPFILTIKNVAEIFSKKKELTKKQKRKRLINDMAIMILGPVMTSVFFMLFNNFKDWDYQFIKYDTNTSGFLNLMPLHSIIATWTIPTIFTLMVIAVLSYIILRVFRERDLTPLVIAICMSGMYIGVILSMAWIIQITGTLIKNGNIIEFYYIIFPINYIICSAKLIIYIIKKYSEKAQKNIEYKNKILNKLNNILKDSNKWPIYALIMMIPILGIIIIILTLFGQRPDSIIQAFTETSDWAFSIKQAPQTIIIPNHDGHYLCTVSLKGHRKIVKPLRYGIRQNHKILVNRQLCVANAFEDLISEKLPNFHRVIRNFYDKYGYPLSKHINNAITADIIYILMKPLEYIFLFFLYLFDTKPENRIAIQYLPLKNLKV